MQSLYILCPLAFQAGANCWHMALELNLSDTACLLFDPPFLQSPCFYLVFKAHPLIFRICPIKYLDFSSLSYGFFVHLPNAFYSFRIIWSVVLINTFRTGVCPELLSHQLECPDLMSWCLGCSLGFSFLSWLHSNTDPCWGQQEITQTVK